MRRFSAMESAVKKSAVLYHYPCPDGAFAALAAHLYFSAASIPAVFFPNTVYDPIRPDNLCLEDFDDVYLLDFAGPPGMVSEISSKAKSVTVLDHHKTALEMLSGNVLLGKNVNKIIDMERSGATIAYDFFKEKLSRTDRNLKEDISGSNALTLGRLVHETDVARINQLFKFIEDGDLWRWDVPDSKAFSSGLKDMNIEYNVNLNPYLFNQLLALDPEVVIKQGQETLLNKQKLIDETLEKSYEIALASGLFGHCLAVDADDLSNLRSELGHQLANKSIIKKLRGIGAVVYKVPELKNDSLLKISLRSVDYEDTTPISQAYGGGGHRNASSFLLDSAELEKWKVRVESTG